jgi:hypothetical protein
MEILQEVQDILLVVLQPIVIQSMQELPLLGQTAAILI